MNYPGHSITTPSNSPSKVSNSVLSVENIQTEIDKQQKILENLCDKLTAHLSFAEIKRKQSIIYLVTCHVLARLGKNEPQEILLKALKDQNNINQLALCDWVTALEALAVKKIVGTSTCSMWLNPASTFVEAVELLFDVAEPKWQTDMLTFATQIEFCVANYNDG